MSVCGSFCGKSPLEKASVRTCKLQVHATVHFIPLLGTTLSDSLSSPIMVSESTDSSKPRKLHGEQASGDLGILTYKINQLKRQIQAERVALIREKVGKNRKSIESHVSQLVSLAMSKTDVLSMENNGSDNLLSSRMKSPICIISGSTQGSGDKDYSNTQEVAISMTAKLPSSNKIPPYTTWIFLDRNQRMAEDQSVVGRRRIYYDQHGSEALICSDSEEEIAEPEEDKHEFSEAEDHILRMVSRDYEPSEEVIDILTQSVGGTTSEIQEFYNMLKQKDEEKCNQNVTVSVEVGHDRSTVLDKSLSATLDSLDNLFCRRCLVFDCRLHGWSQSIITPSEKQFYPLESEEDKKPCGNHCYLRLQAVNKSPESVGALSKSENRTSEEESLHEVSLNGAESGKRKVSKETTTTEEDQKLISVDLQDSSYKRQKRSSAPDAVAMEIDGSQALDDSFSDKSIDLGVSAPNKLELHMTAINAATEGVTEEGDIKGITEVPVIMQPSNSEGKQIERESSSCQWKPLEKELYLKGLEIFGRNSCLIARNLLSGLKTCIEVSSYMYDGGAALSQISFARGSNLEDSGKVGADYKEQEMPSRSRLLRRRGRTRKLKYSWKSAGHPSIWRRIADGKNQSCKHYIPCGCKSMCGKQCPCLENGTCCEKYCGCSKSCKNRFRGCHCAKSQCRSRQCPCFASGRECDPDVCRNCWVSCGDGSLGEPPRRGDGQCGNMRLLLRQQQRILLAKSDVAGWGAFLKNSVNKNDYLGEYTGELISHREADKRGKIYDRANSSFLFDLNDQYVLDAYRKGDKLKFANHSPNPNCYAKVMLVAGDYRVGIFANEHIEASEELFYDYRYGPDQAPIWARIPDGPKGDDYSVPQGRAKKHQSHR